MGAAAQLDAEIRNIDDAYHISILLAEECHSAKRLCLINGHHGNVKLARAQNLLVDKFLDIAQLLLRHRLEIREVKAKAFGRNERSRLLNVRPHNAAQCCLQQMRCGVIPRRRKFFLRIEADVYSVAALDLSFLDVCHMIDCPIGQTLRIADGQIAELAAQDALVPDLSAAFGMERRRTENDPCTLTIVQGVHKPAIAPNRNNCGFHRICILGQASGIYA